MHELYELKEMLMRELEEYGSKGEMTAGSLEVVDKLAHTIKNLCKIIEAYEEEEGGSSYEGGGGGSSYRRGGGSSYAGGGSGQSRRGGSSYARGGRGGGSSYRGGSSYARGGRYSRAGGGQYSGEGAEEMIMELEELMQEAPDEKTRKEFQKFIQKIEGMM